MCFSSKLSMCSQISQKAAERGGYGGERYEQLEFQKKVAAYYQVLHDASWKVKVLSSSAIFFSSLTK